jgi:hypothetical protein
VAQEVDLLHSKCCEALSSNSSTTTKKKKEKKRTNTRPETIKLPKHRREIP